MSRKTYDWLVLMGLIWGTIITLMLMSGCLVIETTDVAPGYAQPRYYSPGYSRVYRYRQPGYYNEDQRLLQGYEGRRYYRRQYDD